MQTYQKSEGTHRGVRFEVMHPHGEVKEDSSYYDYRTLYGWCGYIYIDMALVPEHIHDEVWPTLAPWGFGSHPDRLRTVTPGLFDDLPFHGGVTFCDRHDCGHMRYVKVGCDYRHAGDRDEDHSASYVAYDLREVIDAFLERVPYLQRDIYTGDLYPESEGAFTEEGRFFAHTSKAKWEAEMEQRRAAK